MDQKSKDQAGGQWVAGLPSESGRYFYRDLKYHDYGIALVAWNGGHCFRGRVTNPELRLRSVSIWGRDSSSYDWNGENTREPGWASTVGAPPLDDLEFWSEPIQAPPGIPDVRGRPPDVSQEEIDADKAMMEASEKANGTGTLSDPVNKERSE